MTVNLDPAHIRALYDAILDKAKTSGLFKGGVVDHEAYNPAGKSFSVALMIGPIDPVALASGLAVTALRIEFTLRIEAPHNAKDPGAVDRELLAAGATLMAGFAGDFELLGVPDNLVRNVDLMGAHGNALGFKPGWMPQGEGFYRIGDVTVPLILNDVLPQGA